MTQTSIIPVCDWRHNASQRWSTCRQIPGEFARCLSFWSSFFASPFQISLKSSGSTWPSQKCQWNKCWLQPCHFCHPLNKQLLVMSANMNLHWKSCYKMTTTILSIFTYDLTLDDGFWVFKAWTIGTFCWRHGSFEWQNWIKLNQ